MASQKNFEWESLVQFFFVGYHDYSSMIKETCVQQLCCPIENCYVQYVHVIVHVYDASSDLMHVQKIFKLVHMILTKDVINVVIIL